MYSWKPSILQYDSVCDMCCCLHLSHHLHILLASDASHRVLAIAMHKALVSHFGTGSSNMLAHYDHLGPQAAWTSSAARMQDPKVKACSMRLSDLTRCTILMKIYCEFESRWIEIFLEGYTLSGTIQMPYWFKKFARSTAEIVVQLRWQAETSHQG